MVIVQENCWVGVIEVAIRDRAAESLVEVQRLGIRQMFSGYGFYVDGLLVAAAWDGAFRLRHHEHGSWVYRAVDDSVIDDPSILVQLVRERARVLSQDTDARGRTRPGASRRRRSP